MDKHLFFDQLYALITDEPNMIANLANVSAFINEYFEGLNWVGFYLVDEESNRNELVLGPFQGKPACVRIPIGKGVCGTAALRREVLRVDDVHQFIGHIACDADSRSEIVLPIIVNDELIGVLDIDSPVFNRFTLQDEDILKRIVDILIETCF